MTRISRDLPVEELAAVISEALAEAGVTAVLSGGSVVSIYTSLNDYESTDLDFVTGAGLRQLELVMKALGYRRVERHFEHPNSDYLVEFPPGPLMVGNLHITEWSERQTPAGKIRILTPAQCVMDRLAAFYHWGDRQCLDQAVMVAARHEIDLAQIESWSRDEGHPERFEEFRREAERKRSRV